MKSPLHANETQVIYMANPPLHGWPNYSKIEEIEGLKKMKRLIPVFLMLILVSSPVYADNLDDGLDAYDRKDYKGGTFDKYKLLAEQGNAIAQNFLGTMYLKGEGVPQDYIGAVKWYTLSAEQGLAPAQNNLGWMYAKGEGVTQDYKEAVKWYKLSVEQGHALAQLNLGLMYATGWGVIQDYVQAHMWVNIAVANGNEYGRKARDVLEKSMSLDQINEAKKLSWAWMWEHQGFSKLTADRNLDGKITISDIWFWLHRLYFYPGDFTVVLFLGIPIMAEFFELSESSLGGIFSGVVSFGVWSLLACLVGGRKLFEIKEAERLPADGKPFRFYERPIPSWIILIGFLIVGLSIFGIVIINSV